VFNLEPTPNPTQTPYKEVVQEMGNQPSSSIIEQVIDLLVLLFTGFKASEPIVLRPAHHIPRPQRQWNINGKTH
jgi:hypothetical protein